MSDPTPKPDTEQLALKIGKRAENLYLTGQLLCSEAVLAVMNRGLGGGLPEGMDIRLASALPVGLGNSGCTCGALSGAALAVGLFLGRDRPGALNGKQAMPAANLLHDRFKGLFGFYLLPGAQTESQAQSERTLQTVRPNHRPSSRACRAPRTGEAAGVG